MTINYLEFSGHFSGQKPSPVYLFSGEERYFIDEGVKIVKERFLEEGTKDFNFDAYSASDIDASKVVGIAETLPVMARYRVLIVKHIDEWTSKNREIMLSYFKKPSPTTILILTASKLDRREKFSISIDKNGTVILCQPLYKQNLEIWVRQRIKRSGKDIDKDAINLLTESEGTDMLTLDNDIEKLVLYCWDRKNISVKDVAAVSGGLKGVSVFEVVNAIVDRRVKDAISFLKRAIDDGEPPVKILYFIVREFRMMLKARTLIDAGESPDNAAKAAGVPVFKIKEFSLRIQKFSRIELDDIFAKLMETDGRLKGSALRPEHILERLILSVFTFRSGLPWR